MRVVRNEFRDRTNYWVVYENHIPYILLPLFIIVSIMVEKKNLFTIIWTCPIYKRLFVRHVIRKYNDYYTE